MALRDWRGTELRLLCFSLFLAVAAVSSVGFFVDRVRQGLQRDAAQVLGGDAVLESDHPVADSWGQQAQDLGLRSARSVSFPSMAASSVDRDSATLVAVKAVTDSYPLHGAVQIRDDAGARAASGAPAPGTVWVEAEALRRLSLGIGQSVQLGNARLRVAAVVTSEPDGILQVMGFAPRVLMNVADLPATALLQPASRVSYRLMVAGAPNAVRQVRDAWTAALQRGQRVESLDDGRPELQRTLGRADRYLGLVALLTALVAAVAVNSAARRFCRRRLDTVALLRCLGLAQGRILGLFAAEFVLLGLLASLAGVLAGLGLHLVLLKLLAGLLREAVPAPSLVPGLQGLLCGMLLLLGFGLPPLEQLRGVSPVRVLRRDLGVPGARTIAVYLAGVGGFALLLLWTTGDAKVAAIAGGGFLAAVALFALAARACLRALHGLRRMHGLPAPWRFALAALERQPAAALMQLVALAMGLMALLVLAIVRTDLIDQWRAQAPAQAPNRFIINIQPDQAAAVRAALQARGVGGVQLEPMVRGRLVQIDGRAVGPQDYEEERARSLIDREFNLSYSSAAPDHNVIVQGRWFADDAPELSIEEGIAKRLHIALGQRLRFDVAGQGIEATVTSVRKVNWDSMRVNFFVIMSPALLRAAPQSYITAFFLPAGGEGTIAALVHEFPNLTIIDTEQVLGQVRILLDQLIGAAQFLFAFALVAAVLVLYTALAASQEERLREAALVRALGASRRQMSRAQMAEMLLIGAIAGALAAAGAALISAALARFVFEFSYAVHPWLALAGIGAGIAAALAGAWGSMRKILRTPPLASLRDA